MNAATTIGCEVCGQHAASVTTAGMCLCAPCAGATSHATGSVLGDAAVKTIDPLGLRRYLPNPKDIAATATKPLFDAAETIKIVAICGSVAVIAFVGYEIFKKKPRGAAA